MPFCNISDWYLEIVELMVLSANAVKIALNSLYIVYMPSFPSFWHLYLITNSPPILLHNTKF